MTQKELKNSSSCNVMLIECLDNTTRVAVVNKENNKLLEYDIELSSAKNQKGNIYLAQVSRIETSLQAVFVDYGSDKHGFLSFSEIHPDYYQLPLADKELLYQEQNKILNTKLEIIDDGEIQDDAIISILVEENPKRKNTPAYDRFNKYINNATVKDSLDNGIMKRDIKMDLEKKYIQLMKIVECENDVENSEKIDPNASLHQKYRINEVINLGQVMLVQVIKETKGNKGVPLTTYLSIAGQYCVFMPNSNRNICISRKISSQSERKKIKELIQQIELPDRMGVIIRTAGTNKSLPIIKHDLKNQMQMWENIRSKTVESTAPCLIHEDSHPLNNAIRNMYDDSIVDIYVEGLDAYKKVKSLVGGFMKSFLKHIHLYEGKICLFSKYNIQEQIANIYKSHVLLPSGGHIVIHPTEALVAIDVNSGKATKEYGIEETALKTNLEATYEIVNQIRLRNLSGIVVVDFIDMRNNSNNLKVENYMKECLMLDSAKTQIGHINSFGLLTISRQRLNVGSHEVGTQSCIYCSGSGMMLSTNLAALLILNALEEYCFLNSNNNKKKVAINIVPNIAIHIMNHQREKITSLEKIHNLKIEIVLDDSLVYPNFYRIISDLTNSGSLIENKEKNSDSFVISHKLKSKKNRFPKNKIKKDNES